MENNSEFEMQKNEDIEQIMEKVEIKTDIETSSDEGAVSTDMEDRLLDNESMSSGGN